MAKEKEIPPVTHSVEGCVIDWDRRIQRNPKTGQEFDFEGRLIQRYSPAAPPDPTGQDPEE